MYIYVYIYYSYRCWRCIWSAASWATGCRLWWVSTKSLAAPWPLKLLWRYLYVIYVCLYMYTHIHTQTHMHTDMHTFIRKDRIYVDIYISQCWYVDIYITQCWVTPYVCWYIHIISWYIHLTYISHTSHIHLTSLWLNTYHMLIYTSHSVQSCVDIYMSQCSVICWYIQLTVLSHMLIYTSHSVQSHHSRDESTYTLCLSHTHTHLHPPERERERGVNVCLITNIPTHQHTHPPTHPRWKCV